MPGLQYPQFGGFSLGSDEDEEERKQRERVIASLQPPAYDPSVQPPPPSPAQLVAPRNPELDDRWTRAESGALAGSGYEQPAGYGVVEAIRDFAPVVAGSIADIASPNHGQGVAPLMAAGMAVNADQEKLRQQERRDAGNFALQSRNQRNQVGNPLLDAEFKGAQMKRWANEDERGRANLSQRDINIKIRQAQQAYEQDPENPTTKAMVEEVSRLTDGAVDISGMGAKNARSMMGLAGGVQTTQQAGPRAASAERGRTGVELELAPQKAEAAANQAAAVTTAGEAAKEATPRVYREQAEQFTSKQKLNLDMVGLMDEIDHGSAGGYAPQTVAERFGAAIASFGIPPDRLPTWQAKKFLLEEWKRAQSGAVISNPEEATFLTQLGQNPLQSEEATNAAYDTLKTLIGKRIAGGATGNTAARDVLRQYTSDPDAILGAMAPAPAAPVMPTAGAPRSALPNVPVVPPSAGLRRPAPAAPAQTGPLGNTGKVPTFQPVQGYQPPAAGGQKRMRRATSSTGEVEELPLTDEEAEWMARQPGVRSVD